MIVLSDLYTGYDRASPLGRFNYQFDKKIYGILGVSGCGKTTLLRTIAGLNKPLKGEVLIDETPVKKPGQGVYMMHQNYTSFDWMNCLENVLIAKRIKGKVVKEDIDKAQEMLRAVHLEEHANKYPKQLSGGQRQRLALARTLFVRPEIILMDEPLSALDEATRSEMQELIIDLHKETNNTVIMVTHSLEEAKIMCDEIIQI